MFSWTLLEQQICGSLLFLLRQATPRSGLIMQKSNIQIWLSKCKQVNEELAPLSWQLNRICTDLEGVWAYLISHSLDMPSLFNGQDKHSHMLRPKSWGSCPYLTRKINYFFIWKRRLWKGRYHIRKNWNWSFLLTGTCHHEGIFPET